jgi:uncharacterized Zn finger protein
MTAITFDPKKVRIVEVPIIPYLENLQCVKCTEIMERIDSMKLLSANKHYNFVYKCPVCGYVLNTPHEYPQIAYRQIPR